MWGGILNCTRNVFEWRGFNYAYEGAVTYHAKLPADSKLIAEAVCHPSCKRCYEVSIFLVKLLEWKYWIILEWFHANSGKHQILENYGKILHEECCDTPWRSISWKHSTLFALQWWKIKSNPAHKDDTMRDFFTLQFPGQDMTHYLLLFSLPNGTPFQLG